MSDPIPGNYTVICTGEGQCGRAAGHESLVLDGSYDRATKDARIRKWAAQHLLYLGSGVSRTVYDIGDGRVLKVATYDCDSGFGGNTEEAKLYARLDPSWRPYFATVYAACPKGWWLIGWRQGRARGIPDRPLGCHQSLGQRRTRWQLWVPDRGQPPGNAGLRHAPDQRYRQLPTVPTNAEGAHRCQRLTASVRTTTPSRPTARA
jgi:hypothetical protein